MYIATIRVMCCVGAALPEARQLGETSDLRPLCRASATQSRVGSENYPVGACLWFTYLGKHSCYDVFYLFKTKPINTIER